MWIQRVCWFVFRVIKPWSIGEPSMEVARKTKRGCSCGLGGGRFYGIRKQHEHEQESYITETTFVCT